MIKNEKKLEHVEPLLVEWLKAFEKDYNYDFSVKGVNIVVTEGLRDIETQRKYFSTGKSKTMKSKHLKNKNGLSQAIDIVFEINGRQDWKSIDLLFEASKHFKTYFKAKNVSVTWGGDWNKNGEWKDEKFLDGYHFQLDNTPEAQVTKTLKLGDKNEEVKVLQSKLISKGYKLVADGDFGRKTLDAVKDFQSKNGLIADGVVGYKTLDKLKGKYL